jgi:hypothetical protein
MIELRMLEIPEFIDDAEVEFPNQLFEEQIFPSRQ